MFQESTSAKRRRHFRLVRLSVSHLLKFKLEFKNLIPTKRGSATSPDEEEEERMRWKRRIELKWNELNNNNNGYYKL